MIISLDKFKRNVGPSEPGSGGTGIDFSVIGYGKKDSVNATSITIEPVEYSKSLYEKWDPATTDATSYFWQDDNLVYAPAIDTSNVTNFYCMFDKCHNLKYAPQYNFANATDTSYMFRDCAELTEVGEIDLTNVEFANSMFNGCQNLKEINFVGSSSKLQTAVITSMFENCPAIINVEDNDANDNIISIAQSSGNTINKVFPKSTAIFMLYNIFGDRSYACQPFGSDGIYALYNDQQLPIQYKGNCRYKVELPDENATAEVIVGGTSLGIIETGKDNGTLFLREEPAIPVFTTNDWDNILWQGQSVNVSASENGLTILNASNGQQSQFYITIPISNNANSNFNVMSICPASERDRYTEFYARIYKIRYGSEMYVYNEGWFGASGDGILSIPFDSSDITYYDDGSAHLEFMVALIQANREFTISEFMVEDYNAPNPDTMNDSDLSPDYYVFGSTSGWQTKEPVTIEHSYEDGQKISRSTSIVTQMQDDTYGLSGLTAHVLNIKDWQKNYAIDKTVFSDRNNLISDTLRIYGHTSYVYFDETINDIPFVKKNVDLSGNPNCQQVTTLSDGGLSFNGKSYCCLQLSSNMNIVKVEYLNGTPSESLHIYRENGDRDFAEVGVEYFVGKNLVLYNEYDHLIEANIYVKSLPELSGYTPENVRYYQLFDKNGMNVNTEDVSNLVLKLRNYMTGEYVDFNYEIVDRYGVGQAWLRLNLQKSIVESLCYFYELDDSIYQFVNGEYIDLGTINWTNELFVDTTDYNVTKDEYYVMSSKGASTMYEDKDGWYRTTIGGVDDYFCIGKNYNPDTSEAEKNWGLNEKDYGSGTIIGCENTINVKYPAGENGFTITSEGSVTVWFNESENVIAFTDTSDYDSMINIEISK